MNTRNIKSGFKNSTLKGFTLIELLFATIILGVMFTMAITTFIGVFRFYTWAGTTRVNQQNSRQIMDDIGRLIASLTVNTGASTYDASTGTYSDLCLIGDTEKVDGSKQGNVKIYLGSINGNPTNKINVKTYPDEDTDCTDPFASNKEISSTTNTKVTRLEFVVVYGALNNGIYNDISTRQYLKESVEYSIDVINGEPEPDNNCREGDNFCDKVTYTSVATE